MNLSVADVGILSDDLTGACDVAGYFVPVAGAVRIRMAPGPGAGPEAGCTVQNLQSRRMGPADCRAASALAARPLAGRPVVFQKIDTAFRGPVGAGLEGLAQGLGPRRILVAPAIPRIGRITRGGLQYIGEVPIHETEFARDPTWPVRSADVRENLARTGAIACAVRDAETADDLLAVVDEALAAPPVLLVGSLGLAEALVRRLAPRRVNRPDPPRADRVLVVSGSQYPQSRVQLRRAARARRVPSLVLSPGQPPAWPPTPTGSLILQLGSGRLSSEEARGAALEQLTAAAAAQIRRHPPEGLAIIGGETAFDLLGKLGARGLWIHQVFADVVSYGTIRGGALDGRPCMLKGGSVGPEDAVIRMLDVFSSGTIKGEMP